MILSAILLTAALMQVPAEAPPTPDQVRAMLGSSDAKDQAWGAWWTSESRLSNLEPLLQKNLEAHAQGRDQQDLAVVDATLDAYIQSNSNPPPVALLESVYVRRPAQALILMSRINSELADTFLLQLIPTEADRGYAYEWFAAANILLAHRAPGFAAAVLRDLRIKTTVTVCESASPCPPGSSGMVFRDGVFGVGRAPGFPPGVAYSLLFRSSAYAISISTSLLEGPVAVGYRRTVSPGNFTAPISENGRSPGGIDPPRPSTSDRLKYVAAALDAKTANGPSPVRLPIQDNERRTMQWKTKADFISGIDQIRQDIQKGYSDMLLQLSSNRLLTEDEARELATVPVDVDILDGRTVDRTPLGIPGVR